MPFYVKKPIPVQCHQITESNIVSLAHWAGASVCSRPDGTPSGLMVYTLEGTMTSKMGDYLIQGVRGEFYFCEEKIFEETYDKLGE